MRGRIEIGLLDEIPRRGARLVKTDSGDIAVFRCAGDRVFALRDKCPHKGGPLSQGIVHGHAVTCPLHNWNIDLEDGRASAPDEGCAARYDVELENGKIYLLPGN